ncbi:hypothetical protein TMEN_6647 [Trichophyton mentagrophytes]|uniref:Uncharacterized protein n=2 Tax=Trichophyton interdigitale TaxID=101480 RepID=A0A9P4YG05_9EURO|nr:hypothetical protein H101_02770 [Trichophyton interdigitale H6]KAF3893464.1 hypothetical protein GY632_4204 [Trichophyton interdigitale]KDB24670.1 hypothetical protein H109_03457 [Trichophyton interdigitale MR816]GBF63979.1 hypothetical protein TMEN_6647 [Trichophyton mentagrophytes]KAF3895993.1 hypothetical protein GY631_2318 [Trichophyton interdigitale]
MASTRLRKTFKYPDSDGDDDARPELDDQEQEALIESLRKDNETANAFYQLVLAVIPCVASCIFIPTIISFNSVFYDRASAFLGAASLLWTAYYMKYTPLPQSEFRGRHSISLSEEKEDPISRYTVIVNAVISLFLALSGFLRFQKDPGNAYHVLYVLPAVALFTIVAARRTMVSVDLDELERLRYEYKGA